MREYLQSTFIKKINKLESLTKRLACEKDKEHLLEHILIAIKEITNSDGGTLYLPTGNNELKFEIIMNDSLSIHLGGTSSNSLQFKNLELVSAEGDKNYKNMAAHCYHKKEVLIIKDSYAAGKYDFSGTKRFDRQTGYRTKSLITIPLIDLEENVIGIIQLVNALTPKGESTEYSDENITFAKFLSSYAATTLSNLKYAKDLNNLFESFARTLAMAIDDKSPYTGKHCDRVPEVSMMLMDAAIKTRKGPLKSFDMSIDEQYELKLAALLHDCGKVTTPVHVIDKATKLETIFDRIELIELRYEVLRRDAEIEYLKSKKTTRDTALMNNKVKRYNEDLEFLRKTNVGGEFLEDGCVKRIESISNTVWKDENNSNQTLLNEDEVYNLSVSRGTLNKEEREIINHHIVITKKMLESLDYPKHLKNLPIYAWAHHEKMDGSGFPCGLKGEEIPLPSRIVAIADIFEALTAKDRPYKKGKKLTETLKIMGFMAEEKHIDSDLFDVFIESKVYLKYAHKYLDENQIDEVIHAKLPGAERRAENRTLTDLQYPLRKIKKAA